MTIEELATKIMEAQRKRRHEKHSQVYEPQMTTAGSLGHRCDLDLVAVSKDVAELITQTNGAHT